MKQIVYALGFFQASTLWSTEKQQQLIQNSHHVFLIIDINQTELLSDVLFH